MAENELQELIKSIFNRIKEKYRYTDEQALIYLKGYKDCAEEHQQSLEKRDKIQRDTVAEAKRLLKAAVEDIKDMLPHTDSCDDCALNKDDAHNCSNSTLNCDVKCKWRYADEALKLIGGSEK